MMDLNLLRILDVLLEERSVTRAGARLNLSQSAVSHALNRLRVALGDELLVRGPSGMQPTQRAIEIGALLHEPLVQLQAAVSPVSFDPAVSRRRFNLIAGSYASVVFLPPLARRFAEQAPRAELNVMGLGGDFVDRLDSRQADGAISGFVAVPERFIRDTLLHEDLAWAVSATSALARKNQVTLADIVATPHVIIDNHEHLAEAAQRGFTMRSSWEDFGALDLALAAAGLTRRVAVTAHDTLAALAVVNKSEFATLAPRRVAQAWADVGKGVLIDPPYPSAPAEIALAMRRDVAQEPAIAWFRGLILEAAQAL